MCIFSGVTYFNFCHSFTVLDYQDWMHHVDKPLWD